MNHMQTTQCNLVNELGRRAPSTRAYSRPSGVGILLSIVNVTYYCTYAYLLLILQVVVVVTASHSKN
jgi:hypothetical protein